MPDAGELRAARRAARRAAALSLEELSSFLEGPPRTGLPALLRRCFRFLPYLDAGDPGLASRCRLSLLDALRDVLSRDPSPSLLPAIEVFIENLVFCDRLKRFFVRRDSAAPEGSRVFTVAPPFRGEVHAVLELVCNHFISSLEDENGFQTFLSALSWSGGNGLQGAPEICFREALSLINITLLFSLPSVVRAHLLLLTSRCVSGPDLDSHLLAFQLIMNLYVVYLPALGVFNRSGVENPQSPLAGERPLTSCIKEVTHQKLKNQVNGLLSFCQAHVGDDLPISDSDIYDISDRLIEENQHLLHEKFRQQANVVMMSVLSKVLHCAKHQEVHKSDAEMTEEIICLAAVLRLLGSLLLQILNHFSQMRAADGNENANHVALQGDYGILCDTIRLLSRYEANELHRCDFISDIGWPVYRERASIQMLTHFASLLVFCVRRRLGFLWRICIIMMIMTMNLVILEDKSIDVFQLLIGASNESADIPDTDAGNLTLALIPDTDKDNRQVYVGRRSSRGIALQLGTLQNRSIEKVDGRAFLQCHPEYNPSWNDLDDFFECEQGKDYSSAWNQLKKFKVFKIKKYISKENSRKKRRRKYATVWEAFACNI